MNMQTPTIEFKTVSKDLPVFSTNISQFKDVLDLAAKAIFEERGKNPKGMDSNVKAHYVSDYASHLNNSNFQPLIDIVLSFCEEISKTYFKSEIKFKCYNCWGMLYESGDYTVKHNHYPSTFAAVVYLDFEKNAAPIIIEDQLTVIPTSGSLVVFPAILNHLVPKSNGRRMVVAMNIDHVT
jgi:signal recognition particle subunit SEC65